jgi:hypothetical protein
MDPLIEKTLALPRELRDMIYLFIIEPETNSQPTNSWPLMSQPWPFIVPFETEGNMLWQELQHTFYERTHFHFDMEPNVDFRSVSLPADDPRGLTHYPCRVSGMPSRFGFYRRPCWYARITRATVAVKLPSTCTSAPSGARGPALRRIPGRDLACKAGPHYVAVAKVAWLLQHAVSLRELKVEVTVRDPPERSGNQPTSDGADEWRGLMEPFIIFKDAMKMATLYRKTSSSTVGIIFDNGSWCSDFHMGPNRSNSVIRRCLDPNFELLPGNHWGSYICVDGACPCGRGFEDISSQNETAEEETEHISRRVVEERT